MKTLLLEDGISAQVDDADYERLNAFKWRLNTQGYPYRFDAASDSIIFLHHVVIGYPPPGKEVDHRDTNPLNAQRQNLRFLTHAANIQNQPARGRSGFKGVFFEPYRTKVKPWRARVVLSKKRVNLGYFSSPEEAARAYDKAVLAYYGPEARVNFPVSYG